MGHSTGGLLAEIIAGQGRSAVTVAIDPGVFRGVLPLPLSVLRSGRPVSGSTRAIEAARSCSRSTSSDTPGPTTCTLKMRRWSSTTYVAASGISLAQMGNANLNPWTEAKVDIKNPDRGPLLIIEGEKGHTVPWAIAKAAYDRQKQNPGVTEIIEIPNRGHSPTHPPRLARGRRDRAGLHQEVRLGDRLHGHGRHPPALRPTGPPVRSIRLPTGRVDAKDRVAPSADGSEPRRVIPLSPVTNRAPAGPDLPPTRQHVYVEDCGGG